RQKPRCSSPRKDNSRVADVLDTPNAHYDQPWEEAIEDYLDYFIEFFFPQVHTLIDGCISIM
ncbi:MAG: hypothetical protein ACP5D4_19990, partial [Baaleninema sp.]